MFKATWIFIVILLNRSINSLEDYVDEISCSLMGPLSGAKVGFATELRIGVQYYDSLGNLINPSNVKNSACFGLSPSEQNCVDKFDVQHSVNYGPFVFGWNRLYVSITAVQESKSFSAKCSVDLFREYLFCDELPGFLELSSSLRSIYDPSSSTVAFSSDITHSCLNSVVDLTPQLLHEFVWKSYNGNSEETEKLPKYATSYYHQQIINRSILSCTLQHRTISVPCTGIDYMAYYDLSIVVFAEQEKNKLCLQEHTSLSQETALYCNGIVDFVATMFQRTTGHFVLASSPDMLQYFSSKLPLVANSAKQEYEGDKELVYFIYHLTAVATLTQYVAVPETELFSATPTTLLEHSVASRRQNKYSVTQRKTGIKVLHLQDACVDGAGRIVLSDSEYHRIDRLLQASPEFKPYEVRKRNNEPYALYLNTTAALTKPYFVRNTFHHLQSLTALFHFAYETKKRLLGEETNGISNVNSNALRREWNAVEAWLLRLRYLILPAYDTRNPSEYEWGNTFLSVITSYLDAVRREIHAAVRRRERGHPEVEVVAGGERKRENEVIVGEGKAGDVIVERALTMLFERQWKNIFNSQRQRQQEDDDEQKGRHQEQSQQEHQQATSLVCFQELVLLGQANTNRGFFGSRAEIDEFRNTVWDMFLHINKNYAEARALSAAVMMNDEGTAVTAFEQEMVTTVKNGDFSNAVGVAGKRKLKITFNLRHHNRHILNMSRLYAMLMRDPVLEEYLDREWLHQRGFVTLEWLTFQEQVQLMYETDVFIGVHGSAFANALFMQPHSAVIALMQSRHIEFALPQIVQQSDVAFYFLPVLSQTAQSFHCWDYAPRCNNISMLEAGKMECLGIRNCDVVVDADWLHALVGIAARYVWANKY